MTFLHGLAIGCIIGAAIMGWGWYCDHRDMHARVKLKGRIGS